MTFLPHLKAGVSALIKAGVSALIKAGVSALKGTR